MTPRTRLFLSVLCFLFFSAASVTAQIGIVDRKAVTKPKFVFLGSYHMGTPGNNMVNPKVNDVTTPGRQKQIAQLVEKLKKFKPTRIVLEIDSEDDAKTQETYDKYLAGTYRLSKNETNQIGFRLAKELGHKKVYCVDWSEDWDDPAINYEKFAAKDAEMDSYLKKVYQDLKKGIDAEYAKIAPLPVIDQLIFLNRPGHMEKDHKVYFDFLPIGRGKEYAGANYVSWWYRRNMVILTNIIRLTGSPNDRILVIYGVGHAKLLTQLPKNQAFMTSKAR
jgi:hypothetical protein